ncbi:tRNA G18 (ribose-2'-O)-methylase SpoU [Amorphus suaedae]
MTDVAAGADSFPDFLRIEDPEDPRIAAYRDIRERDLVGREESFIAEGAVVLDVLLKRSPYRPRSMLVAENRIDAARRLLAGTAPDFPVYTANRTVMDAVAGFPLHRGMLAHGHRGPLPDWRALLPLAGQKARIAVLVGLANHDNVGGIFRNAAAFGADAVLLDPTSCDPFYRKAIRVSVGGSLMVPFARFADTSELLDGLRNADIEPLALTPAGDRTLSALPAPARAAVFLGAEGPGLPADVLGRMTTVRIPMSERFDSLNVATTSGIVLHHLAT